MKAQTARLIAIAITLTCLTNAWAVASDAILIEFSSQHCGPCRAMQPILAELEASGVPIRHVDVGSEPHLATRYGIRQTPTFVVVSGGKELTRLVGTRTAQELIAALHVSPHGPLVQTGAELRSAEIAAPQTRLAPISTAGPLALAERDDAYSEAMPSISVADAVQRAQAATVRLRVFDGHGYGAGTGTIIDTHGEEALVLTCGHLFRDTRGEGKIEVDLFIAGEVKTVIGQLIDYEATDRDIALVAIRPGIAVQPVRVIPAGMKVQNGQPVFSFGCDRGDDPSRRDTRITGIDKYNQHLGVSNLEIAGAPIDGRSGGGLFDAEGRLIGVCNAADYKGDIGIYAGPGSVHWQLDRANLAALYQGNEHAAPAGERLASLDQSAIVPAGLTMEPSATANSNVASAAWDAVPAAGNAAHSDTEIIVIMRDRNRPDSSGRVMTVTQPSDDLMRMLQQHTR